MFAGARANENYIYESYSVRLATRIFTSPFGFRIIFIPYNRKNYYKEVTKMKEMIIKERGDIDDIIGSFATTILLMVLIGFFGLTLFACEWCLGHVFNAIGALIIMIFGPSIIFIMWWKQYLIERI